MRRCPQCQRLYSDFVNICPDCKINLNEENPSNSSSYSSTNNCSNANNCTSANNYSSANNCTSANNYSSGITPAPSSTSVCNTPVAKEGVGFREAVTLFFTHYADFHSRSSRAEYWWALLFNTIIMFVASFIPVVLSIYSLAIIVPSIAQTVRRLHDVGKSGWWYLMSFVPLAGPIFMLVMACKESTAPNSWGQEAIRAI